VEGFIQVSNLFLQIMLKHRDQYCVTILMIPVFFDDGIYIHTHLLWSVSWKTSAVTFSHIFILNSIKHKALLKNFIEFFFLILSFQCFQILTKFTP
jgi:hypothetical protein